VNRFGNAEICPALEFALLLQAAAARARSVSGSVQSVSLLVLACYPVTDRQFAVLSARVADSVLNGKSQRCVGLFRYDYLR